MFLIIGIVLLIVLSSPANIAAFVACLVLFAGEVAFWWWVTRKRKVQVGAHTLVGKNGKVVSACMPNGQVHLAGEIWEAYCEQGAGLDEAVRVTDVNGLTLVVEPEPKSS